MFKALRGPAACRNFFDDFRQAQASANTWTSTWPARRASPTPPSAKARAHWTPAMPRRQCWTTSRTPCR
eukprot:11158357-Lingulodinium_polyedra.AAC.1